MSGPPSAHGPALEGARFVYSDAVCSLLKQCDLSFFVHVWPFEGYSDPRSGYCQCHVICQIHVKGYRELGVRVDGSLTQGGGWADVARQTTELSPLRQLGEPAGSGGSERHSVTPPSATVFSVDCSFTSLPFFSLVCVGLPQFGSELKFEPRFRWNGRTGPLVRFRVRAISKLPKPYRTRLKPNLFPNFCLEFRLEFSSDRRNAAIRFLGS